MIVFSLVFCDISRALPVPGLRRFHPLPRPIYKMECTVYIIQPTGSVHDESEFTHRPADGVSRERQYVLPDKQHRLRHRTEFPIFGCTTRAILESTSLDICLNRRLATSQG